MKDATITLLGGLLRGVEILDVSLNSNFIIHPKSRLASDSNSVFIFEKVSIFDGGVIKYMGSAEAGDVLTMNVTSTLAVKGGGELHVNNLLLSGIDTVFICKRIDFKQLKYSFKCKTQHTY